jgi:DNA-binding response OmpR family regulator
MNHDTELSATSQPIREATVPVDCELYSFSSAAEYKLKVFNDNPKRTRGAKILVIDDDLDLFLGLRIRLRAQYDVHIANDADAGLRMAFSEMPDVIILDLGLPDCDGYLFMQTLNEIPRLLRVPVIVLTGRGQTTDEWRCYAAGAQRFFQKPIDDQSLLAAIEQLAG